jgi:hypothetical protein
MLFSMCKEFVGLENYIWRNRRGKGTAEGCREENRQLYGGGHVKGQAPEGRDLLSGTFLSFLDLSGHFAVWVKAWV